MIATFGLTLFFGKSDHLAAAFGIAVSATKILTTGLLFIAMRDVWDGVRSLALQSRAYSSASMLVSSSRISPTWLRAVMFRCFWPH
jgi:K+ transporter